MGAAIAPIIVVCEHCRRSFTARHASAKYCSKKCGRLARAVKPPPDKCATCPLENICRVMVNKQQVDPLCFASSPHNYLYLQIEVENETI